MNELEQLVAKYNTDDDVGAAISECEARNFKLMTAYPNGVPSGVMFSASMAGVRRTSSLLAGMIIEVRAIIENWTEEELNMQEQLTAAMLTLVMGDSLNTVLHMLMPGGEDEPT